MCSNTLGSSILFCFFDAAPNWPPFQHGVLSSWKAVLQLGETWDVWVLWRGRAGWPLDSTRLRNCWLSGLSEQRRVERLTWAEHLGGPRPDHGVTSTTLYNRMSAQTAEKNGDAFLTSHVSELCKRTHSWIMVSDNDKIKLIQFKIYNCFNAINFVLSCLKNQSLWDNFAGLIDKITYRVI